MVPAVPGRLPQFVNTRSEVLVVRRFRDAGAGSALNL